MEFRPKRDWHFTLPSIFPVKRDRFADVVHDNLARIASSQMLLEFIADSRIDLAIHVVVQLSQ
jgi:hypothetical protein